MKQSEIIRLIRKLSNRRHKALMRAAKEHRQLTGPWTALARKNIAIHATQAAHLGHEIDALYKKL